MGQQIGMCAISIPWKMTDEPMYAIFANMLLICVANVGKYTIHGSYG